MKKKELKSLPQFPAVGSKDLLLGQAADGTMGYFPAELLSGNGYASVRFDTTKASPEGEPVGNLDYLRNLPALLGLGCYLVDDGHNRQKLDPTNHYKFALGGAAKLDGTMGQYQWGWFTPWFLAVWMEQKYLYIGASLKPIPGRLNWLIPVASTSATGHGVMDRTNMTLCSLISNDPRYRGGNGSAISRNSLTASDANLSMLGYAATNISTADFEKYAAKRGSGWGAGWYWIDTVVMLLQELVFHSRNIQASFNPEQDANGLYQGGLGPGVSQMSNWNEYNGLYPIVPLSAGVELADAMGVSNFAVTNAAGQTVYNAAVPCFLGLKNAYAHLWRGKNREIAVKQSDGSYKFYVAKSSFTPWDYSKIEDMLYVGSLAAIEKPDWTYISELNFTGLAGVPSVCSGTPSTGYCDGCYRDTATSGFRAPVGAGYADHWSLAGSAVFLGGGAPSAAYAYLSSPLCECLEDFDPIPKMY